MISIWCNAHYDNVCIQPLPRSSSSSSSSRATVFVISTVYNRLDGIRDAMAHVLQPVGNLLRALVRSMLATLNGSLC